MTLNNKQRYITNLVEKQLVKGGGRKTRDQAMKIKNKNEDGQYRT